MIWWVIIWSVHFSPRILAFPGNDSSRLFAVVFNVNLQNSHPRLPGRMRQWPRQKDRCEFCLWFSNFPATPTAAVLAARLHESFVRRKEPPNYKRPFRALWPAMKQKLSVFRMNAFLAECQSCHLQGQNNNDRDNKDHHHHYLFMHSSSSASSLRWHLFCSCFWLFFFAKIRLVTQRGWL